MVPAVLESFAHVTHCSQRIPRHHIDENLARQLERRYLVVKVQVAKYALTTRQ